MAAGLGLLFVWKGHGSAFQKRRVDGVVSPETVVLPGLDIIFSFQGKISGHVQTRAL